MKKEIPYFAIGNDELETKKPIRKTVACPNCKKKHKVVYGKDEKTGKVSKILGFVECGKKKKLYLVAVNQKEL